MSFITFRVPANEIKNIDADMNLTINNRQYKCIFAGNSKVGSIFHASSKEQNMTKAIAAKRGLKAKLDVDATIS